MLTTITALTLIAAAAAGLAGGVPWRAGGLTGVVCGLVIAVQGRSAGLAVVAAGLLAWLAGHSHHALRHHSYRSPLARRIFTQLLPPRVDVTRRWAWPVTNTAPDDHNDR